MRLYRYAFVFVAALLLLTGVGSAAAQDADIRALLLTLHIEQAADGAYIVGDPAAPITIVEFADFACPHCQDYRETINFILLNYVATGQAKLEYRSFPTAGGRRTVYAAQVAECAGRLQPGGFWQAHESLFDIAVEGRYGQPLARLVADELNIDYLAMLGCIWRSRQIVTDYQLGTTLGVSGTPAVFVRYSDGEAVVIEHDGTVYDRGGVPLEVLVAVVEAANQ